MIDWMNQWIYFFKWLIDGMIVSVNELIFESMINRFILWINEWMNDYMNLFFSDWMIVSVNELIFESIVNLLIEWMNDDEMNG
jgi:hypothetical protein